MEWVKLHRSLVDWEWYKDGNTSRLFSHCLLKANWKDERHMGYDIPRGSFVTSLPDLADGLGLSVRQIRTAIEHLKSTGELTVTTTRRFSIVNVLKYGLYQDAESKSDRQNDTPVDSLVTVYRQANDTLTEFLPICNKNIRTKEQKKAFAEFVTLTDAEYQKLVDLHGEPATKRMITILDNYKGSSGKKYASDYRAILMWVVKKYEEERPKGDGCKYKIVMEDPNFDN